GRSRRVASASRARDHFGAGGGSRSVPERGGVGQLDVHGHPRAPVGAARRRSDEAAGIHAAGLKAGVGAAKNLGWTGRVGGTADVWVLRRVFCFWNDQRGRQGLRLCSLSQKQKENHEWT